MRPLESGRHWKQGCYLIVFQSFYDKALRRLGEGLDLAVYPGTSQLPEANQIRY